MNFAIKGAGIAHYALGAVIGAGAIALFAASAPLWGIGAAVVSLLSFRMGASRSRLAADNATAQQINEGKLAPEAAEWKTKDKDRQPGLEKVMGGVSTGLGVADLMEGDFVGAAVNGTMAAEEFASAKAGKNIQEAQAAARQVPRIGTTNVNSHQIKPAATGINRSLQR